MRTPTDHETDRDTEAPNALLRGELSAVETYEQAMGRFDDQQVLAALERIRAEHARAVAEWRDQVARSGGTPSEQSGAWCTFATAVSGTDIGPGIVLAALRQGEELALVQYKTALESESLHPDCRQLIRTDLLPACQRHVAELDRLIGGMGT